MTPGSPDPFISAGNPCRKSLQDISAMDGTAMDGIEDCLQINR
jgi:hypothetical protein